MKELVERELKKIKIADLSHFDSSRNTYIIPKTTSLKPEENNFYIIELKPTATNSNLNINWNKNIPPSNKYYKAEVEKIMGPMIKINGIGYDYESKIDLDKVWSGWLYIAGIEILERI